MSNASYILWSGRTREETAQQPINIFIGEEEEVKKIFQEEISLGEAEKNDGLFLAQVTPDFDEEMEEKSLRSHRLLSEEFTQWCEELSRIAHGEHEKYSIEKMVDSYSSSSRDWLDGVEDIYYDTGDVDAQVTLSKM